MKTLILYYSYGGSTRALAEEEARTRGADLCEVKDKRRPGALKAYTLGCLGAIRGKPADIEKPDADLAAYDTLVLMAPVWASNLAPPFNSMVALLPAGKSVEVVATSLSGASGSAREKAEAALAAKGCTLAEYRDHRSNKQP